MLPVEAQMTRRRPASRALAIAITMPRSLNEPVGLDTLEFEVEVFAADRGADVAGFDEGCATLAHRDHRGFGTNRKKLFVAFDDADRAVQRDPLDVQYGVAHAFV